MTVPTPTTPKSNDFYAALAAATGAYFFAVGARLLPIPGGPSNLNGPLWADTLRGPGIFSRRRRDCHPDARSRQCGRRTARGGAAVDACGAISDRAYDLCLLRR